jgi:hypothetical protein
MSAKTYFRIAEKKYAKGDIMKGRGKRPLADEEPLVETILDSRRPPECPDRGDCVYMRVEREFGRVGVTFDKGYVHKIEPIGKIDKRDLTWIGVLQSRHHKNERLRKNEYSSLTDNDIADKYWSGEGSDKASWEWVAKEAKVLDVDSDLSRVRRESPLLDIFSTKPSPK